MSKEDVKTEIEHVDGEVVDTLEDDYRLVNALTTYGKAVVASALKSLSDSFTETELYMKCEEVVKEKESVQDAKEEIPEHLLNQFNRISSTKDVNALFKRMIFEVYNTTAVELFDLLDICEKDKRLRVDLWKKPVWAVLMQIKEAVVEDAVAQCLKNWENDTVAIEYVERYLRSLGVREEDFDANKEALLNHLSESILGEISPTTYKLFTAVQLLKHDVSEDDNSCNNVIFSNEDRASDYISHVEYYRDNDTPTDAASAMACEETIEEMDEEERLNIIGKAGAFAGKVIKFRYETVDTFNNCLRDSMGEYADKYDDYCVKAQAKKERLAVEKEEEKERKRLEKKQCKEDMRAQKREDRAYERQSKMNQQMYNRGNYNYQTVNYGNRRYNDPRFTRSQVNRNYNHNANNFAPIIPTWIFAVLINIVMLIFIALAVGWGRALFPGLGLAVATFGFIKQKIGEPGGIPMIVVGYIVAVLSLIFL